MIFKKAVENQQNRKKHTIEELTAIAAQYGVLKDFRQKEKRAYKAIVRRGLLVEICGHMTRGYEDHTDEELAGIAARYDDLKEFRNKEKKAYNVIKKRGLLSVCKHMKHRATRRTEKELAEIASLYNSLKDFSEKEPAVLQAIRRRGLYDKLLGHMFRERENYSEEDLASIASKYDTLKDFRKKETNAYHAIASRGLLDKLCGHMKHCFKTKEEITAICKKYDNLKEFRKKERKLYNSILDRGLLDEMCGHMERSGNLFKRKIYVFTFSDGYAYVGLTQDTRVRYRQHVLEMNDSPVNRHIRETGASFEYKVLTDWLDKNIVGGVEESYIKEYTAKGWKMLNTAKGGGLGCSAQNVFTHENILREVAKYDSIGEFKKGSPNYYVYVMRHHLYDKYCSQLKRKYKQHGFWTIENSIKAATGCKSRSELRARYSRAYITLKNAGLLDKYLPSQRRSK